jgi:ketosteroid isomerase-like protein
MSRENVEIVRRVYEEFNRTGVPPAQLFHNDAEFDPSRALPDAEVLRGAEQFLALIADYSSAFEDFRVDAEALMDGGDHVVAVVRDGGRLKGSGSEIWNRFVHVWTLRDRKVVRWASYSDKAEALEAVGLHE